MRTGRPRAGAEKPCPVCGVLVYRHPSTMGRQYCSYKCRGAATIARRVRAGEALCYQCKKWTPVDGMLKSAKSHGGVHSYCKPCAAKRLVPNRKRAYRPAYTLTPEEKKEKKRAANQIQHGKRRAGGEMPPKSWFVCRMAEQDGRCAYCRCDISDGYHIDHIHPISKGGTNARNNLQLLCARCNLLKSDMTEEEFLVSKKRPLPRG